MFGGAARGRSVALLCLLLAAVPSGATLAAGATLIRADRLLDPTTGVVDRKIEILVEGNRISAVGTGLKAPAGAEVIDLADLTLLPGLIDSHTHVCLLPDDGGRPPTLYKTDTYRALEALDAARRNLLAGFTTLRDLDNEGADMADLAVRDAVAAKLFDGPRMMVAGWAISITGGHMNLTGLRPSADRLLPQLAIMADDRDAMIAAIRDQVKAGVDIIKIYATGTLRHIDRATLDSMPQYSRDDMRAMVEEAARWGRDVAAHAYGGPGAYDAVAAGVVSIEHGMLLDDRTLDLMAERGTWWVPTMTVYLPGAGSTPEEAAFRNRIVERHRETFRRALGKRVRIAFGTDAGSLPHGENWRELQRMVDYGMSPVEAIRSATLAGAELLRMQDRIGRIAPGYLADMIAVQGRPEERIDALRSVVFVMADGKIVTRPR